MTTFLKDLFEIPANVRDGDFVLKLAETVDQPRETLAQYVVTQQLAAAFEEALSFIRDAVDEKKSKATYLHGSFGSGKSHFMAVLNLMLLGHEAVADKAELKDVVQRHAWVKGRKLLLVPFHVTGVDSLEAAVLGTYLKLIDKLHPNQPMPALFKAAQIFENAEALRGHMGDDAFFTALGKASGVEVDEADNPWGTFPQAVANRWNLEKYREACACHPDDQRSRDLVSDLVATLLPAYRQVQADETSAYVNFDEGLGIMSRHAQTLGYDGILLLLDELILWLSTHLSDRTFLNRETTKVAKLVEAQDMDRPVPIISFVARQRDLREMVGDHIPGVEKLNFADNLKYWDGRFHNIRLDDTNLPMIVEQRVLRLRSEKARAQLDAAFEQIKREKPRVKSVLLTESGDLTTFRKLYPFSPMLIEVLTCMAPLLQRHRTSIRLLYQLLVKYRDRLVLGELVPVGDLFEILAEGADPLSGEMKMHFEKARNLYRRELLPMLKRRHQLSQEAITNPNPTDPAQRAFMADDRLVKTLVLAALVPNAPCFQNLTAARLAYLNHGQVKTRFKGQEDQSILARVREWSREIADIRISDDTNPILSLQLSGIDLKPILEKARDNDTHNARIEYLRWLVFEDLGIEGDNLHGEYEHSFTWRQIPRKLNVMFNNVRKLESVSLENDSDEWKLVIDFPFDEENHTAAEDWEHLENFTSQYPSTNTICWLPAFFTHQVLSDLGALLCFDRMLGSKNLFNRCTDHLSNRDREEARHVISNRRNMLLRDIKQILLEAYGLVSPGVGNLEENSQPYGFLYSLNRGFQPQKPTATSLKDGFNQILDQAFRYRFPAHPHFGAPPQGIVLKRAFDVAKRAASQTDTRLRLVGNERVPANHILVPLQVAKTADNSLILDRFWRDHFETKLAQNPGELSVKRMRIWIDEPEPRGLPHSLQNLIILTFARWTNRELVRHGEPFQHYELKDLPNDVLLKKSLLPDAATWTEALRRANGIFGKDFQAQAGLPGMEELRKNVVGEAIAGYQKDCRTYSAKLVQRLKLQGLDHEGGNRVKTALAVDGLLESLARAQDHELVKILVEAPIPTSIDAMGASMRAARELAGCFENSSWNLLDSSRESKDPAIQGHHQKLNLALEQDEWDMPLKAVFNAAFETAVSLAAKHFSPEAPQVAVRPPVVETPPDSPPVSVPPAPDQRQPPPAKAGKGASAQSRPVTYSDLNPAQAEQCLTNILAECSSQARITITVIDVEAGS